MLRVVGAAAVVALGLMGSSAFAAPMAGLQPQLYPSQQTQKTVSAPASDDVLTGLGPSSGSVSDSALQGMSGGSGITVGDAQLNLTNADASSSHNVNVGVNTGQIGDQTLTNVKGINTIMQNTGNGVTMQSINNVNIVLK